MASYKSVLKISGGFQVDLAAGVGIRRLRVGGLSRARGSSTLVVRDLIRKHVPTEKSEI